MYFDHQIMLDQCQVPMCFDVSLDKMSLAVQLKKKGVDYPISQLILSSIAFSQIDQCSTSNVF